MLSAKKATICSRPKYVDVVAVMHLFISTSRMLVYDHDKHVYGAVVCDSL